MVKGICSLHYKDLNAEEEYKKQQQMIVLSYIVLDSLMTIGKQQKQAY